MDRNLDPVYFRVKRGEKYENVCFSDLTKEEKEEIVKSRDPKWLISLCTVLADSLRRIGDQFDIYGGKEEEERTE